MSQREAPVSRVNTPSWYFAAGSVATGGLIAAFGYFLYVNGTVSVEELAIVLLAGVPMAMFGAEIVLAHFFGLADRAKDISHAFAVRNNSPHEE